VRDERVPTMAGQQALVQSLGEEVISYLRSGQVLALADIAAFPAAEPERVASWRKLGVRGLIVVPLVRDNALKALLYVHEPEPREWKRSEAAMARDAAERSWAAVERALAQQSLRESEDHYRHAVELNPQVTWTALPDGVINRIASRWEEWTGTSGLAGSWKAGMHPDDHAHTLARWAHSLATGEPYDVEHRIIRRDGALRWARSRAWPRRGPDGAIRLWYGTTEDVHDQKVAVEHQRLLINELNHRVKNTLAIVQGIAQQSFKGVTDPAIARKAFEGRLAALSEAHNLLTREHWDAVSMAQIISDAVAPHGRDVGRFELDGPDLPLLPKTAISLALAIHELATNAVKHGALSQPEGHVRIHWAKTQAEGRARLLLVWEERGGPEVITPTRR
jgi:PAS domain S-box-containing protein